MAQVFISYSRQDKDFVRKLGDALAERKREAWVDWKDIPLTAEWQQEIFSNIDGADNFIFVISPDSVASANCKREIAHAATNKKKMVPIFYRPVPDDAIPEALAKFQGIDFGDGDHFDARFSALIRALDTDLDWTQAHTRLLTRAKEWERNARDSSFLLRGKDLRAAEQWIAKSAERVPEPSPLHSQYVLVSRQAATKLQRIIIGTMAVAFLITVGLAVYGFWQRDNARARELVAASRLNEGIDPELSILLASKSVATTWLWGHTTLPEAEEQLHRALLASHVRLTVSGHTDGVYGVAWSPDGHRLATGSGDHTAKIWNVEMGKELLTLGGGDSVLCVAWSPNGKWLATGSRDKTARIWDVETGKELLTLRGHSSSVLSVAWSPDGKWLATGSDDKTAKVWEAGSGKGLVTLTGHRFRVLSVAWSPNGKRLATGSADQAAKVWDSESGKELLTLGRHTGLLDLVSGGAVVESVAWNPDGRRLATGSEDGTAKVWNVETGLELQTLTGHTDPILSVAWSPDGERLATGSRDQTARVWDARSGKELLTLNGHGDAVRSVAWSGDGQRLATGSEDNTAKVWDVGSGREWLALTTENGSISTVAWSPDGKRLATGSDGPVKVWDAETGKEFPLSPNHPSFAVSPSYAVSVAWSPDGKRLGIAGWSTAQVVDAERGEKLAELSSTALLDVQGVAWSPDGSRVATGGGDKTVDVSDSGTGKGLLALSGHSDRVYSVAWSPDGKWLATGSWDHTARLWDAKTGKELLTLTGHSGRVNSVAWSSDSKRLATGSDDKTAKVWDVQTRSLLRTLSGHSDSVESVAWSPAGKLLVTGSQDRTAKVWDVESGGELLTLGGHTRALTSVAWSPNGKRLATAGADDIVQVYAMNIHDLFALARYRVTAHPSERGCKKYLHVDKCPLVPELSSW